MIKYFLLIVTIASAFSAPAQKFDISGQMVDTLENGLPSATVMLLDPSDSSLVNFTVSRPDGQFEFKHLSVREYLLKVTFIGMRPVERLIEPGDQKHLALGKLKMEPVASALEMIEITAEKAPVTIKKDTIEFNASSFRTKENSLVEDLLKKLPGIEVDPEGNIKAHGQEVKSVTVDGKKFFGDDPKIASKNLPAAAIDKVQVFDKLSDQATFTGVDDGQREKTINLELKEDRRNATFGSLMGGAGSDSRIQGRASLNRFSKTRQLSFLGLGNNVNQAGFGFEDYVNFTGGARQMMGGGPVRIQINAGNTNGVPLDQGTRPDGIMTTYAGGMNINEQLTKNSEVNGSYFVNYLDHALQRATYRENFLPDGNYSFVQQENERNNNLNHRANFTLDHRLDSLNSLRFNAGLVLNASELQQESSAKNTSPDGAVISENERAYISEGTKKSFNSNLLFRHKFNKVGRSVSANILMGMAVNSSTGSLDAENMFYRGEARQQQVHQFNDQSTRLVNYGATISYTEPVGNRKYLEASYNLRQTENKVDRDVFDLANGETTYNEELSQNFYSDFMFHRAGINFRIAHDDYTFAAGASIQSSVLSGEVQSSTVDIRKEFTNLLPSVRFNYDFSNTRHLRLNYETSVKEPEIEQLQPVVDNRDPLNVYVGNPGLRPSYGQTLRLNYTSFNPVSFISFFAFMELALTSNAIVNAQTIDENLARTVTPVNLGHNLRMNSDVNFGFPVTKLSSRVNLSAKYGQQESTTLMNDLETDVQQSTRGANLRYIYEYKEIFDVTLSASANRQQTRYELLESRQSLINTVFGAESNLSVLNYYNLNADFKYTFYQNNEDGFQQRIPLLNLSVSRYFTKTKSLELKAAVMNVFDQDLVINQSADVNFLERTTASSLGRYFMLSLTYALNKQLNPMSMPRRGPMMRIGG